eukprot:TRINITY_DN9147_c0_g1_i1.p1 TRINITY_DN9147_c0_g1~~TRINITY_DN9147_c0_g1_i1.p1  ORF type:complete len:1009 (+),score=207.98 TRINITY_DN9147_c0_g1_i1:29-3028(+)
MEAEHLPYSCIPCAPNWFSSTVADVNGEALAYGSANGVFVLDLAQGALVGELVKCHEGKIGATCVRWVGSRLITGGSEGCLKLWNVDVKQGTVAPVSSVRLGNALSALAVSSTQVAAVGSVSGKVFFVQIKKGGFETKAESSLGSCVTSAASMPQYVGCDYVSFGCRDGSIHVYKDMAKVFHWKGPHAKDVQSLSWRTEGGSDGDLYMASGSMDKKIVVWRLYDKDGELGYQSQQLPLSENSSDAGTQSGNNRVWNAVAWCTIPGMENTLYTTANAVPTLLGWNLEGTLKKWSETSVPPGNVQVHPSRMAHHSRLIFNVLFVNGPTPHVITTSMEKKVVVAALKSSKVEWTLPVLSSAPSCLAMSNNGTLAIGENSSKQILLWKLPAEHLTKTTTQERNPYAHRQHWSKVTSAVHTLAYSKEGSLCFGTVDGDVGIVRTADSDGKKHKHVKVLCEVVASLTSSIKGLHWVDSATVLCVRADNCCQLCKWREEPTLVGGSIQSAHKIECTAYCDGYLTVGYARELRCYAFADGTLSEVLDIKVDSQLACIAATEVDGKAFIAWGTADGCVGVTVLQDGTTLQAQGHSKTVTSLCWEPGARRLCSSGDNVTLWEVGDTLHRVQVFEDKGTVRQVLWSNENSGIIYALCERSVQVLHTNDAMVPTSDVVKRCRNEKEVPAKKLKLQEPLVTPSEWLRGQDGENRALFPPQALEVQDKYSLVSSLLSAKVGAPEAPGPHSLQHALYTGHGLAGALDTLARENPRCAMILQTLACRSKEVKNTTPDGAFWLALSPNSGLSEWKGRVEAWLAETNDVEVHACIRLLLGDIPLAVDHMSKMHDYRNIYEVVRRWPCPESVVTDILEGALLKDVPSDTKAALLIALGRGAEAYSTLLTSSKASDIKLAYSLQATQEAADRYAIRWLLGEDPSVVCPPDGKGGAHCAVVARMSLVMDAAALKSEVADPAAAVCDLREWMSRVEAVVPSRVANTVGSCIASLLGGEHQT